MEIITYGNTELLAGVLKGVSYIFSGSPTVNFKSMMLAVGGIGFIMALVAYAFQPAKLAGWYWLATVLCVSTALVMPRTDVQVIDRLQNCSTSTCVKVVNDVPYALALLAATTSKIGDSLTEMFETTFQNVKYTGLAGQHTAWTADTGFRGNGMMFGNKLIREATRVSFTDPNFRYNLLKYLDNCAGPDVSDGTIDANELRYSPDLWDRMSSTGGNPARYTPVADGGVMSCARLRDALDGQMEAQVRSAKQVLSGKLNADAANADFMNDAAKEDKLDLQVKQAYLRTRLQGDGSITASQIIRQNAMINAMADAKAMATQRTNDPTALMLGMAEAQAKISTNSSWITSAKIAEQAMPLIRNGIEAILYAVFPIVVLVCLVLTGSTCAKFIGSYASALLWIQLWPPLYAVLNYMAGAVSANHIASAGAMPNGQRGLSLLTSASIYENTVSDIAVVGYLVVSIPVFAWALIKGMQGIAGGAIAGASAFSAGSSIGASQAASGGVSLGQSRSEDIRLAPSYSSANYSTWENGFAKGTNDMSGRNLDTMTIKQSSMGVDASFVSSQADSLSSQASMAAQMARREATASSETLTAALNQASSLASVHGKSTSSGSSGMKTNVTARGDAIRDRTANGETAAASQSGGTTAASGDSVNAGEGWQEGTSASVGVGVPGGGVFKAGVDETVSRNQKKEGVHVDQKGMAIGDLAAAARNIAHMDSHDKQMSAMEILTTSSGFRSAIEQGDQAAISLQESYNKALAFQQQSEAHFQQSQDLSNKAQYMRTNASSIAVSYNNALGQSVGATPGGVEKFADMLMNDPGAAGQWAADVTQGLNERTSTQAFGNLAGRTPSENLPPSLPDDGVSQLKSAYAAAAPTSKDVGDASDAYKEHVATSTAEKGLHPGQKAKGRGGKLKFDDGSTAQDVQNTLADKEAELKAEAARRQKEVDGKLAAARAGTPSVVNTNVDPARMLVPEGRDPNAPANDGAGTQGNTPASNDGTGGTGSR